MRRERELLRYGEAEAEADGIQSGSALTIASPLLLSEHAIPPANSMLQLPGPTVPATSAGLPAHEPSLISRHGKAPVPECPVNLRRSARINKYDGFKVPPISDTKIRASKVKPRVIPSVAAAVTITEVADDAALPPPTPIPVIQHVGHVMCRIPAAELAEEELLASKDAGPSSDAA